MSKNVEKKPRKNKKMYDMPEPLPKGTILSAVLKTKWKIGDSIGKGGFGEIYSASNVTESEKKKPEYKFVVKIEPHVNGPLFVEMNFYLRNCKEEDIKEFKTNKKLAHLGLPSCKGHGSHDLNDTKYRFLVMDRFGADLWSRYLEGGKQFPLKTVFQISIQMLDVLEYIHSRGFVHADVKGSNILLSLSNNSQVFLVDFGLASRYTQKEYKADPRFAHNGTIEYTSRDAHMGVPTRRGDIEILLYNMIHWAGGTLPWENLTDPKTVQSQKESHMENVSKFLEKAFGKRTISGELPKLFKLLSEMKYDSEPKYSSIRSTMMDGLKKNDGKLDAPLNFSPAKENSSAVKSGKQKKRKSDSNSDEVDVELATPNKRGRTTPKRGKAKKIPVAITSENDETEEEIEVDEKPEPVKASAKKGSKKKVLKDAVINAEAEEPEKKAAKGKKRLNGNAELPVKFNGNKEVVEEEEEGPIETAEMKKMRLLIEERKLAKGKKKTSTAAAKAKAKK